MTRFVPVLLFALAAAAPGPSRVPVHSDAPAVEAGILDATRAFMHDDAPAARVALDRVAASCRRLARDEPGGWPEEIVNKDVGMHAALDRAREFASRGLIDESVNSLVWVQRTCRECHALRATTTSPSDSGSPTPRNESKP